MNIKTFIDRPVLSCVLSVFIVLLGAIGLSRLPMEQFTEIAPPTVRVSATYTGANAETLQRSVIAPLIEAIVLVILVVMLFLQNFRSSLIPGIAIIVSLVGTLAFLYFVGFSLNMLTLFALVLVIGTVVDDAIVVVEAVQSQKLRHYWLPSIV